MEKTGAGRAVALLAYLPVIGLAARLYAGYQRDIQQARERISAGSQIAETTCGPIEYAVAGNGPPVLVVHGATGGFDQGMAFSGELVQGGFRVIAMSRFGYLRTPLPHDASPAAQAGAHACLLDALNIRRAAVIGASAGAPSAIQFALRYPERIAALVLLAPVAYAPRPRGAPPLRTPAGAVFLLKTALRSDFLFWAVSRLARRTGFWEILATPRAVAAHASADERARLEQVLECMLPVGPRRLGMLNDVAVISSLSRDELERIAAPTLILGAADDLYGTFDGARYSAEHISNARLVGYPTGGHLWVGHQKEVVLEIASFLNALENRAVNSDRWR
jgi:2-hydroxy-6-oxonona-2,4-dienedioate hydrolase